MTVTTTIKEPSEEVTRAAKSGFQYGWNSAIQHVIKDDAAAVFSLERALSLLRGERLGVRVHSQRAQRDDQRIRPAKVCTAMKVTKARTLEHIILDDGEKLKQQTLIPRSGTSWQGQLFLESVKAHNQTWPTGETDGNGGVILRMPSVDEVISRAIDIVTQVEATLRANGWLVDTPTSEDLLDDGGGRVGFMVDSRNGKADQGSPPLPAALRPTQGVSGPGYPGD